MPKDKKPADNYENRARNYPGVRIWPQRHGRVFVPAREGWEPAERALDRERNARGARLRSRTDDEADPADHLGLALIVAMDNSQEEPAEEQRDEPQVEPQGDSVIEPHQEANEQAHEEPQPGPSEKSLIKSSLSFAQPDLIACAVSTNLDEVAGPGTESTETEATSEAAGVDKNLDSDDSDDEYPLTQVAESDRHGGESIVIEIPAANNPAVANVNTVTATTTAATKDTEQNVSKIVKEGSGAEECMDENPASSLINTMSIELDFGQTTGPPPDVSITVNDSSIDTSTMDSDAESI
ncbi:uncharacterized protein [Epargyreus clarus]|uniref:uncharacterized protein isoform X2 n=1 Tax=Epargyreus clarus TaxID=520877 RepID=UPI003C2DBE48